MKELLEHEIGYFGNLTFQEEGNSVYLVPKAPRLTITQSIFAELLDVSKRFGLFFCLNPDGLRVMYYDDND